ncbi:OPT oligopeptide transporter [Dacryopinax primogenitus]|uniref:OPT oligopeptide transporter n=1 Tax=Dacryopinax primogenitus (strain DJM 731) TaxID=1858805 RepID=M5G2K8_DACPD|nr:OPT oligopeptide transporter [Dacryopinax primogenitus]EJT97997.1 OPT oligopeptide transporter [Dacryopinax primogenitus]
MPCNTFRVWLLGLFFTVLISGVNQFFSLRYPSIQITSLLAQLLALPLGKALERVLSTRRWRIWVYRWGKGWVTWEWTLNPGPFNIKEHTLISVMANVVAGGAYATEIVAAQRTYYNQQWDVGYQLCLVISSQLMGFSLAGICRPFLVWPASMIWPQQLVSCAVLNTLHSTWGFADGLLSRWKFFWICLVSAFLWYWVPGYLFTGLSAFSWLCWALPEDVVVNQLFGTQTGLGMGLLTFDWSEIAYVNNPLVSPWWAEANVLLGLGLWFWILTPILYYKNVFYLAYLPMSTGNGYDNTAQVYNVTRVIANGAFNVTAYKEYSPLFIPATFAMDYAVQFATLTGTIVHTLLWYREDIIRQFRASLRDEPDVHSRLMSVYREVPYWWYAAIGLVSLGLGILTIEHWDTQLPVWAYFLSLAIPIVYVIPLGILQAITNQQIGLNVVTELIVGYALPGKPIAMMIFKTFGYITMTQALSFVGDLKFGHYMKVPPRIMFMAQTIAALVACFVVVFVQIWMFGNIEGLCAPGQVDGFTCPAIHVFATASVIFGGVGPQRLFGPHGTYAPLMWFFLIGAILPIPFYFLARRYPASWFRYVNIPIIFAGTSYLPPATGINYSSWGLAGFIFQYLIRRKRFMWWSRYNYILSAALDGGTVLSGIVIFFVLFMPYGSTGLQWWGNTVSANTADGQARPLFPLGGDNPSTFGPPIGSWS